MNDNTQGLTAAGLEALADEAYNVWRDSFYDPQRIKPTRQSERERFGRVVDLILAARGDAATEAVEAYRIMRADLETMLNALDNENWRGWGIPQQLRRILDAAPAPTEDHT